MPAALPVTEPKVPILISYHYMRKWTDDRIAYVLGNPVNEVLLDSGAFSALNTGAEIPLDEYCEFLDRWGDKLFGYMLLDKLGDPVQSARNYDTMLERGLEPIPIHVRGDDQKRMDQLFETSDYIALGGLRRPKRGWSTKGYVELKMQWADGRAVHWLGYTRYDMLPLYRPYSCDSANIMQAAMYGLLGVFEQGKIKNYKRKDIINRSGPSVAMQRLLDDVGATWDDLKHPLAWKQASKLGQRYVEFLACSMTVFGFVRMSLSMQRNLGTRVFLAVTGSQDVIEIINHASNKLLGNNYPVPDSVSDPVRPMKDFA